MHGAGAADRLENLDLQNGWVVGKKIPKRHTGTGGWFSTGYEVAHNDGRRGYLKAMDFSEAFGLDPVDMPDKMKKLVDSYIFERDICIKCSTSGIKRVVHAIAHGSLGSQPDDHVDWLIFERADCDIREFIDTAGSMFDTAFAMRTLHAIAAALQQLHQAEIAHQDLKPSNVLVFAEQKSSKLGDLGRAWSNNLPAPHDNYIIPGDRGYAPPEMRAKIAAPNEARRYGYDMYLLGSMVVFLFARVHINSLIDSHLASLRGHASPTTFDEFLTYYQFAFSESLAELSPHLPGLIRDELLLAIKQLCNPDYRLRGNPVSKGVTQYSLRPFVTLFDLLRYRIETSSDANTI